MKSETTYKLVQLLKENGHQNEDLTKLRWAIEDLLTEDQKYNGWTNYETWLMGLVLSNEEGLYNSVLAEVEAHKDETDYKKADYLKDHIEERFYIEDYSIIRVDCETWTLRDFQEINWLEIVENFQEK